MFQKNNWGEKHDRGRFVLQAIRINIQVFSDVVYMFAFFWRVCVWREEEEEKILRFRNFLRQRALYSFKFQHRCKLGSGDMGKRAFRENDLVNYLDNKRTLHSFRFLKKKKKNANKCPVAWEKKGVGIKN